MQSLPFWLQEGGEEAMLRRMRTPEGRDRALADMRKGHFGDLPWKFDAVVISYVGSEANRDIVGKSVEQIASEREADPLETYLDLVDEESNHVGAVVHNRVESDVRYFLSHPLAMIGSDGTAVSPTGVYAQERPHPRFYGTYPRILGRYVREQSLMSLETAVQKMTSMPAERLRLRDRGRVEEGCVADLAVFDPETVIDRATFDDPHQLAAGVPHVLVAGELVVHDGAAHGGAAGARAAPGGLGALSFSGGTSGSPVCWAYGLAGRSGSRR